MNHICLLKYPNTLIFITKFGKLKNSVVYEYELLRESTLSKEVSLLFVKIIELFNRKSDFINYVKI